MSQVTRRHVLATGALALAAAVAGGGGFGLGTRLARAGAPAHINADAGGLALYGYDPVAYFTDGSPLPGDTGITATHDGATYRFVTTANRDAFMSDPAKYLPVYGGYCAYGLSQGYKVKVDPTVWKIVDGKLYLNYDAGVGVTWAKDIPGYIAKANELWPGLRDKPRSD